jgi:hypothetical protein
VQQLGHYWSPVRHVLWGSSNAGKSRKLLRSKVLMAQGVGFE